MKIRFGAKTFERDYNRTKHANELYLCCYSTQGLSFFCQALTAIPDDNGDDQTLFRD